MILTTIKLHGRAEKRKEIIQTLRELANQLAEEEGCLKAEIYQDIDNKDRLYFMEEWQTRKDLDKYKKSRSLAVILGLESLLVEELEIKYSVRFRSKERQEEEPQSTSNSVSGARHQTSAQG
ncbi:putative quinol monooxygenase [Desulfocastanea catecholica]